MVCQFVDTLISKVDIPDLQLHTIGVYISESFPVLYLCMSKGKPEDIRAESENSGAL